MSIIVYDLKQNVTMRVYHESSGYLYRGGPDLMERQVLNPEYAFCRRLMTEAGEVVGYHLQPFSCIPGAQVGQVFLLEKKLPDDHVVRVRLPMDGNNLVHNPQTGEWEEVDDFEVTAREVPKRERFACTPEFVREWATLTPDQIAPFLEREGWPHLEAKETWGWSIETLTQNWTQIDVEDRILSLIGLAKGAHFRHFGKFSPTFAADGAIWPIPNRALQSLSGKNESGNDAFDLDSALDIAGAVNTLSNWALLTKMCSITAEQAGALVSSLAPLGALGQQAIRFQTTPRAWRGQTESGSAVRCLGSMTIGQKILSFVNVSGKPSQDEPVKINGQGVGRIACTLWKMNDHWGYLRPEEQRSISILIT